MEDSLYFIIMIHKFLFYLPIIDLLTYKRLYKKTVFISFVYGDPVPKYRDQVWERLTRMGLTWSDLWFIIGDLNEITGN